MAVITAPLGTSQMLSMLLERRVYPDQPTSVELKETHMSWIFLTDRHAYKLRKPIRYNSQDYTTLQARLQDAKLEIELNRRLTEDLYLGIVPVIYSPEEGLLVEGKGEAVEWMVKMRRLPADRMMDCLIRIGKLSLADIRAVSAHLARFYTKGPPIQMKDTDYLSKLVMEIQTNHDTLSISDYRLASGRLEYFHRRLISFVYDFAELFRRRIQQGHIIDGHGDLRPEHICIETDRAQVFDCLQFSRELRIADCADELSFLALECERIGDAESGYVILRTYSEITKDHPPGVLIDFYKAYRASMWARLALWRTKELPQSQWGKWLERAYKYVGLAEKYSAHLPIQCC